MIKKRIYNSGHGKAYFFLPFEITNLTYLSCLVKTIKRYWPDVKRDLGLYWISLQGRLIFRIVPDGKKSTTYTREKIILNSFYILLNIYNNVRDETSSKWWAVKRFCHGRVIDFTRYCLFESELLFKRCVINLVINIFIISYSYEHYKVLVYLYLNKNGNRHLFYYSQSFPVSSEIHWCKLLKI